jgi:hypothetical protein
MMSDLLDIRPVPGAPAPEFIEEAGELHICGHCFQLRWPRVPEEQHLSVWCACDQASQDRPPPTDGDLASNYRLCWGCGIEVIEGNSKWSVLVCEFCKSGLDYVNADGRIVAPIGPHSVQHGISLSGGPHPPEVFEAFTERLNAFMRCLSGAYLHARFHTAELCRHFGLFGQQVINLDSYLAAAKQLDVDKFDGLRSLISFMQNPIAWSELDPENRPIVRPDE